METTVDTNVFIGLLSGGEEEAAVAQAALENVSASGSLVVSPVVYSELLAGGRNPEAVGKFLHDKGIEVTWRIGERMWREAGVRFGRYARDRKRQADDPGPRRILADFLIGAHALHPSRTLLTADARIFGTYFPEIRVLTPEQTAR